MEGEGKIDICFSRGSTDRRIIISTALKFSLPEKKDERKDSTQTHNVFQFGRPQVQV
jgi:hypothetical protein